jgi:amino acid transporter
MIQRIQTIYLLLVTVLSGVLFLIPLFAIESLDSAQPSAQNGFMITTNSFLLILSCAIGIISFLAIFFYKKRPAQVKACNLNMILICIFVGLLFYTADTLNGMNQKVHYQFGTYIPLIQLVFTFLAIRGIKKDEELVRSANRLR